MTLMELTAILTMNTDGFTKGVRLASALTKAFTFKAIEGIGKVTKSLVKTGVEYNKEMETMQTSFKTMTGSAEKAAQIVDRLKKMGAETPFETADLAKTTQLLMQYGFTADDAVDKMAMLGDIAQGNAQAMTSVATGYAQMHSAGKVNLQDIKQMINAGFNPLQEISERTGESMASLYDRISKGTMSVDEITASMQYATSEGGKFYKSMENQSKTLNGQLSTVKDNWKNLTGGLVAPFTDQLAKKVLPTLNKSIGDVTDALLGVDETANVTLPDVSNSLTEWLDSVMQEWTDGVSEDDATVQGYVDSFTAQTATIKDALWERIHALSGSDDPEAQTSIADAQARINEIETLEKRVRDILKAMQGGEYTPEMAAELQSVIDQINELQTGASKLDGGVVTPWERFADSIGSLAEKSLTKITGFITFLVDNPIAAEETLLGIATGATVLLTALHPISAVITMTVASIMELVDIFSNWDERVATPFKQTVELIDEQILKIKGRITDLINWLPTDLIDFLMPGLNLTDIKNALNAGDGSGAGGNELTDTENSTGTIATNLDSAAAHTLTLSTNVSDLKKEASDAGVSFNDILDAVEKADGNEAVLAGLLNALIKGQQDADALSTSVENVEDADGKITGKGISSLGSSAESSGSKLNRLVSTLGELFGYDGKTVSIGVNYATSGDSGYPKKAVGIDYVPYNGATYSLHEGEMVLTKLEAQRFRRNEEQGLNATSGSHGASAGEIGAAVAAALSGMGIDIDGKRAGRLMRKGNSIAQNDYSKSVARGYGY